MVNKKWLGFLLMLSFLVPSTLCFAVDVTEQDVTPGAKKIYLEPQKNFIEKGSFNYLLGVSAGYDNNAHLDSSRDGDSYLQTFFRATFNTTFTDQTKGNLTYELMNLMYGGESDLDLVRNGIKAEVDHTINDQISVSSGISFDSIEFLTSGDDDYYEDKFELKVTHKLPQNFYHSLGYNLMFRIYDQRCTRVSALVYTDKERADWRNGVEYEIGKYFESDLLKLELEYFNNKSNERYLDYYDYDAYKIGSSYTHIFNDKIFSYVSASQQSRNYKQRSLIDDANTTEWERTWLTSAAVFYNLNSSVSFGLNYSYRQNYSNEPADRYSGSLISLATYWKF